MNPVVDKKCSGWFKVFIALSLSSAFPLFFFVSDSFFRFQYSNISFLSLRHSFALASLWSANSETHLLSAPITFSTDRSHSDLEPLKSHKQSISRVFNARGDRSTFLSLAALSVASPTFFLHPYRCCANCQVSRD